MHRKRDVLTSQRTSSVGIHTETHCEDDVAVSDFLRSVGGDQVAIEGVWRGKEDRVEFI